MKKSTQKQSIKIEIKITIVIFFCLLFNFLGAIRVEAKEITSETVIGLVNQARMLNGLNLIKKNDLLMRAAIEKMNDMFSNDYFAHTSPKGTTPWYWIEKSGYDYKYAGENLAVDFSTAEKQQKAWMDSATHRKNILNPNYQEIGVAVGEGKIDGKETILTVQFFGTQMNAPLVGSSPSRSGNVQGEEINEQLVPTENNPVALKKNIVSVTLPSDQMKMSMGKSSKLAEGSGLAQQFSWLVIFIIFALSFFINITIVGRLGGIRFFHLAK